MKKEELKMCNWCKNKATQQTENGKYNESIGALPQNHGWFCDSCWKKGEQEENEAIYGECLNNCKC